jgi:hypothetical protein
MLTSVLLALTLGQACPEPPSRNGPPPCAAANVPGCLPGYRASRDESGRRIYVCDLAYGRRAQAPAPAPREEPPPAYSQPEQQYEPQYPAPAPAYPPSRYRGEPPGYEDVPVYREGRRGQLAIVLMPGVTTGLEETARDKTNSLGALGLELRGQRGGARVRFALQYASFGRIADVTLKYNLVDKGPVRPFLGIGVGGATVDPDPDWRACGSIVGGVDLYLSKNVFLTAELQGRRFASRSSAATGGLEETNLKQTAALFGLGLYL